MADFMLPFLLVAAVVGVVAAAAFYWHRRRLENWRYFKQKSFLRPRQARRRRSFNDPLGGPADPPAG